MSVCMYSVYNVCKQINFKIASHHLNQTLMCGELILFFFGRKYVLRIYMYVNIDQDTYRLKMLPADAA